MSYCVNCGVELEKSQKRCPLCGTPVINPNESTENKTVPPYPTDNVVTAVRKMRHMTALLISIILLVPLILCPLCNFIISKSITWSIYSIMSVILGWFYIVPPILLKNNVILKCAWIDYFSTGVFLYGLNTIITPDKDWFSQIVLPLLSYLMAVILVYAVLVRSFNIKKITYVELGFVFAAVMGILTEYVINSYGNIEESFIWSLPAAISCLGVALLLLVISKITGIRDIIKKFMHV